MSMDRESMLLLPSVCALLADCDKPLPDDTSLEKLLDRLTELSECGVSLPESCPCLLDFIATVSYNTTCDPSIISFALKLSGLMAATDDGFRALQQERLTLDVYFNIQHWQDAGLWEDPCIRIGWIQGLRRMLLHQKALCFFVLSGSITTLLQLQTDTSLFVASAASQLLAHILITFQAAPSSSNMTYKEDASMKSSIASLHPDFSKDACPQYTDVVRQISDYIKESLVPKDCTQVPRSLQVLKLLALILDRAVPPLREQLLQAVAGSLEDLVEMGYSHLTPALMDVIMAVYSSDIDEGARLLSFMLSVNKPADLIHAAAAFLHRDHHDAVNSTQAVKILLMPIHICTDNSLLGTVPAEDRHHKLISAQLKSKTSFISMVCVCLRNAPQMALMPPNVLPCPPALIVHAVVSLLRCCNGDISSSNGCSDEAFRCIVACGKVQKCALDALASLSSSPGANTAMDEVFQVLILYMGNPDSDPTVLHKSYKALIQWMNLCADLPSISQQLREDVMMTVKKRVCDPRWEVRDSSVEFLAQLANVLSLKSTDKLSEDLLKACSTTPLLKAALQDPESYVRASAISALAGTLAPSWRQGAALHRDEADIVSQLLDILSEDTEGFARRAVVQYFISWFTSCSSPPLSQSSLLSDSVRTVLSRGSVDLDWEVKLNTLELAELLLDTALSGHPGYKKCWVPENGSGHPYAALPDRAYALHTCTNGQDATLDSALSFLVDQGVISALLSGLVDCDRPVGLKASRLLITVRDTVCPLLAGTTDERTAMAPSVSCELPRCDWGKEIRKMLKRTSSEEDEGQRVSVCKVLTSLGLDECLVLLSQSSDHVHNSFLSLLQDILSTRADHRGTDTDGDQGVIVDCY
ncbi:BRCA1-associated ATM activator 1 [Dunckerocampus dactyliophorus]|uniref:BRCA1-associated ATM activator 1 n=1 Tax=Dunckerocampus dactyliophorus TaxID=161453 RepID=UPI002405079E|nr:BRCA1-associated ATM activator 1 [Dunckerocampus dactyliophorus]